MTVAILGKLFIEVLCEFSLKNMVVGSLPESTLLSSLSPFTYDNILCATNCLKFIITPFPPLKCTHLVFEQLHHSNLHHVQSAFLQSFSEIVSNNGTLHKIRFYHFYYSLKWKRRIF